MIARQALRAASRQTRAISTINRAAPAVAQRVAIVGSQLTHRQN